jgi:hypothetical protein
MHTRQVGIVYDIEADSCSQKMIIFHQLIRYGVIGDDGGMITFRRGFESTKSWSFHLDIVAT